MPHERQPEHEKRYKQNWLQQFRAFYYVCKTGSFTQAAEILSLEQPTVSLQISALEHEFEVRLLDRGRASATATPEGEVLLEMVAPVVEAIETIKESFEGRLARLTKGEVRCSAGEGISTYVLPRIIESFHEHHPEVEVTLISVGSSESMAQIARGEVDAIIVPTTEPPAGFASWLLGPCDVFLVAPPHHPLTRRKDLTPADLADCPLIAPTEHGLLWLRFLGLFSRNEVRYSIAMRVTSPEARLRLVHHGLGLTIVQGACRASPMAGGVAWIPLDNLLPPIRYRVIARRHGYLSLATKRFIDHVVAAWPPSGT